jgi:hypothetical protein
VVLGGLSPFQKLAGVGYLTGCDRVRFWGLSPFHKVALVGLPDRLWRGRFWGLSPFHKVALVSYLTGCDYGSGFRGSVPFLLMNHQLHCLALKLLVVSLLYLLFFHGLSHFTLVGFRVCPLFKGLSPFHKVALVGYLTGCGWGVGFWGVCPLFNVPFSKMGGVMFLPSTARLKDGRLSRSDSQKAAKDLNMKETKGFEQKETKETKLCAKKFPGAFVQGPSQMLRSFVGIVVLKRRAESSGGGPCLKKLARRNMSYLCLLCLLLFKFSSSPARIATPRQQSYARLLVRAKALRARLPFVNRARLVLRLRRPVVLDEVSDPLVVKTF